MYYYFSGAKAAVDASRTASQYYQETKAAIAAKAPKSPNEALDYLRDVARSYLVIIPGARPHVDAAFDTIDELRSSHGDDVNRIISDGYDEVRVVIKDSGNMDAATAMKILDVLRRRSAELEELGKKAGKDAFGSLSEKYPQLSDKLGGGYEEFRRLAESKGPEAKKLYDETSGQVRWHVVTLKQDGSLTTALTDQGHLLQGLHAGQHRRGKTADPVEDVGGPQVRPVIFSGSLGPRIEGGHAIS